MNIKAYRLSDRAVMLRPATEASKGDKTNPALEGESTMANARQQGWNLLCPVAFEATWNGGARAEDIEIRLDAADDDREPLGRAFVQSQLGAGLLTFYPGYQFKTEGDYELWVRGPINAPKDGLAALEHLVNTSLLPCTITIQWKFTRPNQTVRFAAGEPFATLLLYAKSGLDEASIEVMQGQDDVDTYEQAFQQMVDDSPALRELFVHLGTAPHELAPQSAPKSWADRLTNPPPVSCICPTYGRVELLEEAIESFLRQDYPGPKELIVLNDYDGQMLVFDHPEVHIINLPRRFHSVGEKYKAAVALASHDLIFVWHDDDIYLPHRLSYSVARCDENTGFFKADQAWFWNHGKLSGPERNLFHGGSCWRRELFSKVQGYPHIGNQYDLEFERSCKAEAPDAMHIDPIQPPDIYYIYRWRGTDSYHFSALGADGQAHQKVAAYVTQQAVNGQIPQGEIRLKPQWQADYGALVQEYLATPPTAQDVAQAEQPAVARATNSLPVSCFDTIDGRIDLAQFEPDFFFPDRFFGKACENYLKHHGEIYGRDFYIIDELKLVYLSIPKVACTAIKLALAKAVGMDFEPGVDIELAVHHHPKWSWAQGKLTGAQSGYYRFTFVRNPFDRLVSSYRQKIIVAPTSTRQAPLFRNYFFALPANVSFADFAQRVSRIPDALADGHFKSQYALLYSGEESHVDYVGKFEQIDQDWRPIAEKYQFDPVLVQANVSKNKLGCHSDYRLYYTEPLVQLVYERYRKDVHTFGYEAEYEQLLAFVRQQPQNAVPES